MGNALKEQGKLDEAIRLIRSPEINPDLLRPIITWAMRLKKKATSKKLSALTKGNLIKAQFSQRHTTIWAMLSRNKASQIEAIEAYKKALSIKPDYADAYNNMGNVLKDQGKI